jgi:hypothetical protein
MATGYSDQLREWLPGATELRLVAKHEGRDAASVNAFIDAANGKAKTLTFVETENGRSICGGYLDVAWVEGGRVSDQGRGSFIFTLRNHLGVPPTKFVQKLDEGTAYMRRGVRFHFGMTQGFAVCSGVAGLISGWAYDAPRQGPAIFNGDRDLYSCDFRAARWELWEII